MRIFSTDQCTTVLPLVTVTMYEIWGMDLERVGVCVCVCGFYFGALEGFGNPFFNKRHRVLITDAKCNPWDIESEPIVCIGA